MVQVPVEVVARLCKEVVEGRYNDCDEVKAEAQRLFDLYRKWVVRQRAMTAEEAKKQTQEFGTLCAGMTAFAKLYVNVVVV